MSKHDNSEILKPIPVTGQHARITSSIIAGQPRHEMVVEVVEIDGDRLRYRSGDFWFTDVTRSEYADWELLPDLALPPVQVEIVESEIEVLLAALRVALDSWEMLEAHEAAYYLQDARAIDREILRAARVKDVQNTLEDLDAIWKGGWDFILGDGFTPRPPHAALLELVMKRARDLATDIRNAVFAEVVTS